MRAREILEALALAVGEADDQGCHVTIPPELAYGEAGRGDAIPPHATPVFEVEPLEVA